MRKSYRRILSLLLSIAVILSITIPVAADDESRTVTLGFENVEWHTDEEEPYCSADITATLSTEDETFDAMLIQFNVVYNTVAGVLALDTVVASDTIEKVTHGSGRSQKTSTMAVSTIDAEAADEVGYATVLIRGDDGIKHPIQNGQVIATAYFLLADESMQSIEAELSFSRGVINYIDESTAIQNYTVNTSATATVPALVPVIVAQELGTVTLNPSEVTAATEDQSVQASVTAKDDKAVTSGVKWTLDRTDGVSVNSAGVITVTSTASGDYVVTASPEEGVTSVTGTAQATLKVNPMPDEPKFDVVLTGGTLEDGNSSGKFKAGDTVTITANSAPSGKVFDRWTGNANILDFINGGVTSANSTFTMPGTNVNLTATFKDTGGGGCYVATAVYGSYDCPEVWTLRRFRDRVLAKTWYGRLFIHFYYAVSPTAVKLFGETKWFQDFFRNLLDPWVSSLQADGFESTPYQDRAW